MGRALFYHLTQRPLEVTVTTLLTRSLQQGWRVAVRGTDAGRLDWLDQTLWLGSEEGFLPHGLAGGPHDADQPILLTTKTEAPNAPACLMSIDGAEIPPDAVETHERAWILFDGHDPAAVQRAREQWTVLKTAGCKAEYWSEESGRWEKKAET